MSFQYKYSHSTKGFNAEVVVAKAVAYTTQTTYANFVANAVEGEIGIFSGAIGTPAFNTLFNGGGFLAAPGQPTLAGSATGGTLAAATYYYKITAINGAGETVGSPEVSVTTTGTTSSVQLSWGAVAGATAYRVYRGTATGAESAYQQTAATVFTDAGAAGTTATVPVANTAATTGVAIPAGSIIFIAQKRDGQVNKTTPFTYTPGVTAVRTAYLAPVKDVWTISAFPTFAAGQVYSVNVIETTSGNQPNHVWNFDTTAKSTDTNGVQDVVDRLVLQINDQTNPVNYAFGQAMVATRGSSGANSTLVLTAVDFGRSYRIALREDLAGVALSTHTTQAILGIGIPQNVQEVEAEGFIFAGTTTNYPGSNAVPAEFGIPTSFVDLSNTYNTYIFAFSESEDSPTPVERHFKRKYIVLFTPVSGTSPDASVRGALGI